MSELERLRNELSHANERIIVLKHAFFTLPIDEVIRMREATHENKINEIIEEFNSL